MDIETSTHERSWLPCNIVVFDPHLCLAGQVALVDEYVGSKGGIGICFETGQAQDLQLVDKLTDSIWNDLFHHELNLFSISTGNDTKKMKEPPAKKDQSYEIFQTLVYEGMHLDVGQESSNDVAQAFQWAANHGQENFEFFSQGQEIGRFGLGLDHILIAPEDCYLLFPKIKALWKKGRYVISSGD